jgi:hypothetical protein
LQFNAPSLELYRFVGGIKTFINIVYAVAALRSLGRRCDAWQRSSCATLFAI